MYRYKPRQAQNKMAGVAMLSMLLVLALVTVIAVILATQTKQAIQLEALRKQQYQTELDIDALVRHFHTWWLSRPEGQQLSQAPNGFEQITASYLTATLRLTDLNARFNLTNLYQADGSIEPSQYQVLKSFLQISNLPADIADYFANSKAHGASWATGVSQNSYSYVDKHHYGPPLFTGWKGFEQLAPRQRQQLGTLFTALPGKTGVNIQTASTQLLVAILPGVSQQRLDHAREYSPDIFESTEQLLTASATAGLSGDPKVELQSHSSYYQLEIGLRHKGGQFFSQVWLHCAEEKTPCRVIDWLLHPNLYPLGVGPALLHWQHQAATEVVAP